MTLVEPIPDLQWGKGNWQDYISNWRTRDTNWMQERLILRYQTPAARTTDWGATPKAGQVTYNDITKSLEMWRDGAPGAWVRSLMFQYLVSNKDDSVGVNISHSGAASFKGIIFGPTLINVDLPISFLSSTALIDATGLALKVGDKTAKLATDATALTSDSPFKAPSLDIAGAANVGGVLSAASASIPALTVTSTLTFTGATLSGGILNGASGTIGGVQLINGGVISSGVAPAGGLQHGQGHFYGDAISAVMRQRPSAGGSWGSAYLQATVDNVILNGTLVQLAGQPRVLSNRAMQYATNANGVATTLNGGPVIYQSPDPGVNNVPEGTIWLLP